MLDSQINFSQKIFNYIDKEYGKTMLQNIQSGENKVIVNRLLESSCRQNDTIEHSANKIIAMLRLNP